MVIGTIFLLCTASSSEALRGESYGANWVGKMVASGASLCETNWHRLSRLIAEPVAFERVIGTPRRRK